MEYKAEIPKKGNLLKAEIVSFLNSEGGTILLGADDQGRVLEEKIKDYKRWEEILSNWIFNAFYPEVIDLIQVFPNEIPFRILIKKGKEKPYFYKEGEGFHAKGVYIRVGSSKRVASFQEIQRMIFATKSHEYESLPCEKTNLTFQYLENKLEEKGITFDSYGLSLLDKEGKYNNAALLLSDQNPTISKFAVFQGLDVSIFLDKKEFRGSILKQLDDILYFSNLSNKKKIIITGKAQREEHLDIPEKALREAIVNCYCHRDWTLSGDIKIEFYDDRVMIFSPGSLPDGLTLENIKQGMVAKRNRILVSALDKADMIENYASGIRRIFQDYEDHEKQPNFYISENGVIVTLYNRNYDTQNDTQNDIQNDTQNDTFKLKPVQRRDKIIEFFLLNNEITAEYLAEKAGVSLSTIRRDLAQLRKQGKIEYIGSAKEGKWKIK